LGVWTLDHNREEKEKNMNFEKWPPDTNVPLFSQFSSKSFETLDLKKSIHKRNNVEVTFFQNFKTWRHQPLFYTFGSYTAIFQPILTYKPI
jgi:hypothetical protein